MRGMRGSGAGASVETILRQNGLGKLILAPISPATAKSGTKGCTKQNERKAKQSKNDATEETGINY